MKKTNQANIQAKMFDFALSELIRTKRNSFDPKWTVDSWVKLLIWLSLNCGLSGERESLETFVNALGTPLTVRMRKIFFERTVENLLLYIIAEPADPKVLVMPLEDGALLTNESCKEALNQVGLCSKVNADFNTWEKHHQLIAIPWNSLESGC